MKFLFAPIFFLCFSFHGVASSELERVSEPKMAKFYDEYGNQQGNPLFDLGSWHGFLLPNKSTLTILL